MRRLALSSRFSHSISAGDARADPADGSAPRALRRSADWLVALRQEARDRGFSDALLKQTLAGLEPLERVVQSDRSQAELNPGFARYLSTRLTPAMIRRGKEMASQHKPVLGQVEQKYDVQRRFLLALWGMETRYGRVTGNTPVFQALATLAWEPRRATYFRGELFNALTMVQRGHIEARIDDRIVGGRDGPDAVHAVELSDLRRGLRRRRPSRHLEVHRRRARVDRELSQGIRLEW